MALTALVATVTVVRAGRMPGPRIVIGAFATAVALVGLADVVPNAAAGIAATALVATLVASGPSVFAIGSAVSGRRPAAKYETQFKANISDPATAAFFGPSR